MKFTKVQTEDVIKQFLDKENGLNEVLEMVINSLMVSEREVYLSSNKGVTKGNGYRKGQVFGRGRELELRIPRDRLGQFYPTILSLLRDQDAQIDELSFCLYSKGLTTRQVGEVLEVIYGRHYCKSKISAINTSFYEQMQSWRERALESFYPVIYIDAIHLKVKRDTVANEAFYIILGLKEDFTREVIGLVNIPTESASGWQSVLEGLKQRGLQEVELIVSDGLKALEDAVSLVFPKTTHQKCTVHLMRNVLAKVRSQHKKEVAYDFKQVLNPDQKDYNMKQALKQLNEFTHKWGKLYAHIKKLPDKQDINYYFNYLNYNHKIRRMIYTTNWIERFNKDCKRTTKIRNSFPSPEAALALITSVAIDKSEKKYTYPIHNFKFEPKFVRHDY